MEVTRCPGSDVVGLDDLKSLYLEYELDPGHARVKLDGSGRRSHSFLLSIVSEEVLGPTGPDDYCV